MSKYVTLHVDPHARAELQRLQLDLQARAGRRLSLGATLVAAVAVAEQHLDEAAAALTSS